jgi:hypothetical protein
MGCNCGGRQAPAVPLTSGDFEQGATAGMPRFKVIRDEIDPATGEPIVDLFETHRAARLAQTEGGGKLRIV